jgi:hypothetical protein
MPFYCFYCEWGRIECDGDTIKLGKMLFSHHINLEKCKKTEILSLEKYNLFAFYACIEVRCCIFAPTNTSDVVIKIIKYDSTHAKIFA